MDDSSTLCWTSCLTDAQIMGRVKGPHYTKIAGGTSVLLRNFLRLSEDQQKQITRTSSQGQQTMNEAIFKNFYFPINFIYKFSVKASFRSPLAKHHEASLRFSA